MKRTLTLIPAAMPILLVLIFCSSAVFAAPTVTAVAVGYYHTLFIESDGSLWGMGRNDHGQLGDGSTTDRYVPVMIEPSDVVAVAAGAHHSLFLKSDGKPYQSPVILSRRFIASLQFFRL